MSSASSRGVIRFRITSSGLILGGTRWFIRVSHPIVNPLQPFLTTQLMPILVISLYEEVLVEQQSAIHLPDTYQIIINIRARVDGAMGHPVVFHNPEEVIRLMHGIQSEWSMLEQMPAPRRSRSLRDGVL